MDSGSSVKQKKNYLKQLIIFYSKVGPIGTSTNIRIFVNKTKVVQSYGFFYIKLYANKNVPDFNNL